MEQYLKILPDCLCCLHHPAMCPEVMLHCLVLPCATAMVIIKHNVKD